MKNVIRHDKSQLHVLIDTRITGEAMHTRERHCADNVTFIDSVPREIYNTHVQHLRTVMISLQIVH